MAAADMPEWGRRAAAVGRSMAAPFEGADQLLKNMSDKTAGRANAEQQGKGKAMEALYKASDADPQSQRNDTTGARMSARKAGAAGDLVQGALAPATKGASAIGRILQGMGIGGGFGAVQPVESDKGFAGEKTKQVGGGAALGGGLTGVIEGALKTPGALQKLTSMVGDLFKSNPVPTPGPKGVGAEKATSELQRTRTQQEGGKVDERTDPLFESDFERGVRELETSTKPLREEAFAETSPVKAAGTLKTIEALEKKNPDKKVRAALDEVRGTVQRAMENKPSPKVGADGRMSAADFKAMQAGKGDQSMNVAMADEVRQSINRMISQKGDNALDAHTKQVLAEVRDALMEATPQSYRKYLDTYTKEVKKIDKFNPQQSVLGKTTSGERDAKALTGPDAQKTMEKVFTGDRAARDMKEAVEWTGQNPEALKGLRQSFKEWLYPAGANGAADVKGAAKRWTDSRDAVQQSGLFEPKHFEAMDKVMQDLVKAQGASHANEVAASAGGYIVGALIGRPGSTAYAARQLVGRNASKSPEQIEQMISAALSDPAKAQVLAAPPTPENLRKAESLLSADAGEENAKPTPKKRPRALGMQPAGI